MVLTPHLANHVGEEVVCPAIVPRHRAPPCRGIESSSPPTRDLRLVGVHDVCLVQVEVLALTPSPSRLREQSDCDELALLTELIGRTAGGEAASLVLPLGLLPTAKSMSADATVAHRNDSM